MLGFGECVGVTVDVNVTGRKKLGDDEFDWYLDLPLEVDGVKFYRQAVVREGNFYAWVTVEGGAKEAAKWSCDVSVGELAYRGLQVRPIDNTVEDILESGQFLAIARQQAKPSVNGGLSICVDYNIKKK